MFPFGFGLSYTTFAYSNPRLSAAKFKDVDGLTVTVDVTNTGSVAGKEIVQVYVHDQKSGLVRPQKELKGFAKVELRPGETKSVSIQLDFRAFAYYHPKYQQWITEDGDVDILVAASVVDIRHTLTARLESTLKLPCRLDKESTIRDWIEDPRGKVVMAPLLEQMEARSQSVFGSSEGIGMNVMDMFQDMPLLSVLLFQQRELPMPAEDLIAGMLVQAHSMG